MGRLPAMSFLLLGACFPTVSDQFVCEVTSDCGNGRICERGFCVVPSQGEDAGMTPDDATSPDAPPDAKRVCVEGDQRIENADGCFAVFRASVIRPTAEANCTALNMHLAIIKNATTNQQVSQLVGGTLAFLGATDAAQEGTFLWPDGTPVLGGFENFRNGEPNDGGGSGEDCLVIEGQNGGTWDDRPCNMALDYVCQFP